MTLKDKMRILQIVARRRNFNNLFEINELINEAWKRKSVREAKEPYILYTRAKNAMIDYIRIQNGRPHYWDTKKVSKKVLKPSHKYRTFFHSLQTEDGFIIEPIVFLSNEIEHREHLNRLIKNLTRTQKLIVKLRINGFKNREIGEIIPCSESRVSQIWMGLKEILKERMELSK